MHPCFAALRAAPHTVPPRWRRQHVNNTGIRGNVLESCFPPVTAAPYGWMSRRRRNKTRTAASSDTAAAAVVAVGGQDALPRKALEPADHGARVTVDAATWEAFKQSIGPGDSVGRVLGDYVTRHVHHHQARQARNSDLDDSQLLDALKRAEELQNDLAWLLWRIEDRLQLDHQQLAEPSRGDQPPLPFKGR
jgi:hypothetical protein